MPAVPDRFSVVDNEVKIAAAYNQAGYRYGKYADGSGDKLFCFEGRHAYADRKTWELIDGKLLALRAGGLHRLRVLDLGCGPGTWLRRVVVRAKQMGFTEIEAQGLDIADAQL
ncbi:MAG TPA: class I SAM-dependent methyltransferase, partial [Rhizomicrobium sp.]|nr:class I SAM-dependent methyltransferase [Rhizomicrobium sp.]